MPGKIQICHSQQNYQNLLYFLQPLAFVLPFKILTQLRLLFEQILFLIFYISYHRHSNSNMHRQISAKYIVMEDQLLGRGSTGNVYLGYHKDDPKKKVAVKAVDTRMVQNQVTRYLLSCQIGALTSLSRVQLPGSENTVKLYEVSPQGQFIYLVLELMEGGTLTDYLKKYPKGVSQVQALDFLQQMLEGYLHVRGKGIVHRDLKPDNIMFRFRPEEKKQVALIDFGYCQMETVGNRPNRIYNVGSPKYMAPQAYKDCKYSQKSDVWGFGITLYQMLTGKTCDEGMTMTAYLDMVFAKGGVPLPDSFSHFVQYILRGMLCVDIEKRFSSLHCLREIKKFVKMRNQSPSREEGKKIQKNVEKINPKPGIVFHEVLAKDKHAKPPMAPKKIEQSPKKELKLNNQTSIKEEKKQDRTLLQSKSTKVIHNYNIQQSKPAQKPSILSKALNGKPPLIKKTTQEGKSKTMKIDLQLIKQKQSKKEEPRVCIRSPSPNHKINFNFVANPVHISNDQPKKQSVTCHNIMMSPRKEQKVHNMVNRTQDNKIKIHVQNSSQNNIYLTRQVDHHALSRKLSNASPVHNRTVRIGTQKKLVGGFTLDSAGSATGRGEVSRRDRIMPNAHQFMREDARQMRQISLPKNIPQ